MRSGLLPNSATALCMTLMLLAACGTGFVKKPAASATAIETAILPCVIVLSEAQERAMRDRDLALFLAFTNQQRQLRHAGATFCPEAAALPASQPTEADVMRALVYGPSLNPNWI